MGKVNVDSMEILPLCFPPSSLSSSHSISAIPSFFSLFHLLSLLWISIKHLLGTKKGPKINKTSLYVEILSIKEDLITNDDNIVCIQNTSTTLCMPLFLVPYILAVTMSCQTLRIPQISVLVFSSSPSVCFSLRIYFSILLQSILYAIISWTCFSSPEWSLFCSMSIELAPSSVTETQWRSITMAKGMQEVSGGCMRLCWLTNDSRTLEGICQECFLLYLGLHRWTLVPLWQVGFFFFLECWQDLDTASGWTSL